MTNERRQAVTDAKLKVKEAVEILDEALALAQGTMLEEFEQVGDIDDLPIYFDILVDSLNKATAELHHVALHL
jgi:hypothetical protein